MSAMSYFEKRFGGDLVYQPQEFLDLFVELGYLSNDVMCKWRDERRGLLSQVLAFDVPDKKFFNLLAHQANMVRELNEIFPGIETDQHKSQMLLDEFILIIPALATKYFEGMQWGPDAEHYIYNFGNLTCVSILKRVLGQIGASVDRIQTEVTMLIQFRKGVFQSQRCNNINRLKALWDELKGHGSGSLVYTYMMNMLPKDDDAYQSLNRMIKEHMRQYPFI